MENEGRKSYELDVKERPNYHDGTPRKAWDKLDELSRWSWERGPTLADELIANLNARVKAGKEPTDL